MYIERAVAGFSGDYCTFLQVRRPQQRGMTLIELIIFIMVVSLALAGVLTVFNTVVRSSADPILAKQAMAVAEALLEEISLKDFCDPSGAVEVSGTVTAGSPTLTDLSDTAGITAGWLAVAPGLPGASAVATIDAAARSVTLTANAFASGSTVLRFLSCTGSVEALRADYDDIRDYHDNTWKDVADVLGTPVFSPASQYQTRVRVSTPALVGTPANGLAAGDVLLIEVDVKTASGDVYTLSGYRYHYD